MPQFNNIYTLVPRNLKDAALKGGLNSKMFGSTGKIRVFTSRSAANREMRKMKFPVLFQVTGLTLQRLQQVDRDTVYYVGNIAAAALREIANVRANSTLIREKRRRVSKGGKRGRGSML